MAFSVWGVDFSTPGQGRKPHACMVVGQLILGKDMVMAHRWDLIRGWHWISLIHILGVLSWFGDFIPGSMIITIPDDSRHPSSRDM